MDLQKVLAQDANFSWLPAEALPILDGCFDMAGEEIPAGEHRETDGRIGYLLAGTALVNGEMTMPGSLFGIRWTGPEEKASVPAELTAETDCRVLWFQYHVVEGACYLACWFHARLMQELDKLTPNE